MAVCQIKKPVVVFARVVEHRTPFSLFFFFSYYLLLFLLPFKNLGRGGGASGRAVAFCLSEPGSNPGMDLGLALLVQKSCESFLAGRLFFSKER